MKRKVTLLLMAFCLIMTAVFGTGCSGTTFDEDAPNSEYSDRKKTITLSYYLGGYGESYWNALAKDFMENYDEEIYLQMNPYVDSANMRSLIQAGEDQGDIVQISVDMFRNTAYLEELSEVLDMTPLEEDTKIKDKDIEMYNYYLEEYKVDGQKKTGVFQMPAGQINGHHFAYNKTTLDEAFAGESYTLPRTTDEFFAFGDELLDKGVFLTSAAISDASGGGDYLTYLYQLWFAQLMGLEDYNRFYKGEIYDKASKTWSLSSGKDVRILSDNKDEIIDAYTICDTLLSAENAYLHSSSSELDYLKNDKVFAGGGCGSNRSKTGFLFIGSWFEKEIEPLIADELIEADQTYGMMRTPVASSIVKYLEYRDGGKYMSDSMLSSVIEAIDSGATSYKGVSKADFARIKEARKMIIAQICSEIVVPKISDESKREDIYKVLRYLTSDRAQKVAAEAVGGLNMMPFGAPVNTEELDITVTNFVKECNEVDRDPQNVIVDYSRTNSLASQYLKHTWYYTPGGERMSAYIYRTADPQTPEKMYDALYNNLSATWANYVKNYKTALGSN